MIGEQKKDVTWIDMHPEIIIDKRLARFKRQKDYYPLHVYYEMTMMATAENSALLHFYRTTQTNRAEYVKFPYFINKDFRIETLKKANDRLSILLLYELVILAGKLDKKGKLITEKGHPMTIEDLITNLLHEPSVYVLESFQKLMDLNFLFYDHTTQSCICIADEFNYSKRGVAIK